MRAGALALLAAGAGAWVPMAPPPAGGGAKKLLRATPPDMMPIGVPKVAYRVPGASSAEWVEIYNRLYRERIIFLGQQIDDQIANQIIGVMLYLDSEVCLAPFSRVGTPLGPVAHASTPSSV